jgi:hypothetical protein
MIKNKFKLGLAIILSLCFFNARSIDFSKVKFWIGEGSDSAMLVVSLNQSGIDSAYCWGVRFNGTLTGFELLDKVEQADRNFAWKSDGGFLDSIAYNSVVGKNATNGYYWGIYSYDSTWNYNSGLPEVLGNGSIYGVSFTNFNPEVLPAKPSPALNPEAVKFDMAWIANEWFGVGEDSAFLVIDFNPIDKISSFVFGIRFQDSISGFEALKLIENMDTTFQIKVDAFLNDISYGEYEGIGGAPNYWATWSATNFGNWVMNVGLQQKIGSGDFFGCTYTDFNPALRPNYPLKAINPNKETTSVGRRESSISSIFFPNPFTDKIEIKNSDNIQGISICNTLGVIVYESQSTSIIDTEFWEPGVYFVKVFQQGNIQNFKILKK